MGEQRNIFSLMILSTKMAIFILNKIVRCTFCGVYAGFIFMIAFFFTGEAHFSNGSYGHTHEDVDQLFSRISTRAGMQSMPTLPELQNVIQEAYSPTAIVNHLDALFDLKSITTIPEQLKGIEAPHNFRRASRRHAFSKWQRRMVKGSTKLQRLAYAEESYTTLDIDDQAPTVRQIPPQVPVNIG